MVPQYALKNGFYMHVNLLKKSEEIRDHMEAILKGIVSYHSLIGSSRMSLVEQFNYSLFAKVSLYVHVMSRKC